MHALVAAVKADGWTVARVPRKARAPDASFRKGALSYLAEIRAAVGGARRAILRALLADAILQSRSLAAKFDAQPIAILAAPALSEERVRELADYVREFGGDMAWGVIDERGLLRLHGPDLAAVRPAARDRRTEMLVTPPRSRRPPIEGAGLPAFTDLGQWMLKVLLAPQIPERWLKAPRVPIRNLGDLAAAADVSVPTASRLLSGLAAAGHVAREGGVFRLLRVSALLEAWRMASQRPVEERLARFLLPTAEPALRMRTILAARPEVPIGERACLALFSACRELELGFVRGAPVHIFSETVSDAFLESLELHPAHHRAEADVIVRRPRFPESVFRACVDVGGAPVADALQCWLDVSAHPARGAEQAAEIGNQLHMAEWDR